MVKPPQVKNTRFNRFEVTPAFRGLLLDLIVTFLIDEPTDIIQFGIDYFDQLKIKYHSISKEKHPPSLESDSVTEDLQAYEEPHAHFQQPHARVRRQSVFAEAYNPEEDADSDEGTVQIYPKTDEQRFSLETHLNRVMIFSGLEKDQLNTVLDAMFFKQVKAGENVITQGDEGDYFYVIETGKFRAFVNKDGNQKAVFTYDNSGSFGELALLYSMPRSATITAITDGSVWCLDRGTFRKIVLKSAFKKRKLYEELIDQVPMLQELNSFERMNLADSLVTKTFEEGDIIMREGDEADGMYIVESGSVIINKRHKDKDKETEVLLVTIEKGGYFGELSLVTKQPRAASAFAKGHVSCAFLNSEAFERLLGPCRAIMARNAEKYQEEMENAEREQDQSTTADPTDPEVADPEVADPEVTDPEVAYQ